jgi:signal transduction histidine kinase
MRLPRPGAQRLDELAGLALGAAAVVNVLSVRPAFEPVVVAAAFAACAGLAVAVRRRAPLGAVCLFFGAMLALQVQFGGVDDLAVGFFGLLFVPYGAGAFADGRRSVIGLAVSLAGYLAVTLLMDSAPADFLFGGAVVSASWVAGRAVRVRVQLAGELHEAAQRAEEARDEEALRAVTEERRRIAREMHDVVAHSVSVMVVQAGGARRILERDPERAVQAARHIEDTGRAALVEMRRLLGVLHHDEDEHAARAPQPTMSAVAGLVERAREAGLPVTFEETGTRRSLPAGLDLAAFRVVQEGLTNALKYSGHSETSVRVEWGERELVLEVADRGPGPAAREKVERDGGGHGLVGMRERVRLYGGELETGQRRGGGFRIRAKLPLVAEAQTLETV